MESVEGEGEGDGAVMLVGVSSRTNLELLLTAPTTLQTPQGPATVTRVGLWVDEPQHVAGVLRQVTVRRA